MSSRAIALYKTLAFSAAHTPQPVIRSLVAVAGLVGPRVAGQKRVVVEAQLRKVTGALVSERQLRRAFASYVRYWFDAFRLPSLDRQQTLDAVTIDGIEHLTDGLAAGKGVIVALPHIGNWDAAGAWVTANGWKLTAVAEQLEPPELFEWFKRFRSSFGLSIVVNGPRVGSQLLSALKRNEFVALLCDRDVDGTGGKYEFFGEVTRVPKGPATLALRTGAALIPVAVYEDGRRYRAKVLPPLDVERRGKLSEDVDRVTAELIRAFESLISEAPEQWHVFQPNWSSVRALVATV